MSSVSLPVFNISIQKNSTFFPVVKIGDQESVLNSTLFHYVRHFATERYDRS